MLNNLKFSYVSIDQEELAHEMNVKGKFYANVVHWTLIFSLPIFWLLDYIFLPHDWVDLLFVRLIICLLTYVIYMLGNKKRWPHYVSVSAFGAVNMLLNAGICAIVPVNNMLPYFLLFSIVILLFNITVLWEPKYSLIQCCVAFAGLVLFYKLFNRYDGYETMVANGAGVFFVIACFSCLIAYNRYQIFKRETARGILIEEANNRLLEQNEKINDQHQVIEEANRKVKKLSDYRFNTLNMMLHDFRNFTGSIQMSLDLMHNTNGNLTAEQKEILGYIAVGNDKLKYLAEKVATSTDSEAAKVDYNYAEVNFGKEVEKATMQLADAAQMKQIHLLLNIDPSSLMLYVDKIFLEQILTKLFSNVIRYAQSNSVLAIYTLKVGNKAVLEITNKGKLIGMERMHKLFNNLENLNQTNQTATQSVLGFATAKKLTEQMGGKLTYNSVESTGNFYRLEFNLTQ